MMSRSEGCASVSISRAVETSDSALSRRELASISSSSSFMRRESWASLVRSEATEGAESSSSTDSRSRFQDAIRSGSIAITGLSLSSTPGIPASNA